MIAGTARPEAMRPRSVDRNLAVKIVEHDTAFASRPTLGDVLPPNSSISTRDLTIRPKNSKPPTPLRPGEPKLGRSGTKHCHDRRRSATGIDIAGRACWSPTRLGNAGGSMSKRRPLPAGEENGTAKEMGFRSRHRGMREVLMGADPPGVQLSQGH